MTRLPPEFHRLYQPLSSEERPSGSVRAMVLALGRPAEWPPMASIWEGVQRDLGLPAPGIAVSGTDAFQLWFSLAMPVPAAEARRFLTGLTARYLQDVAPHRLTLIPDSERAATPVALPTVPAQVADEQWSAFVARDLAPVFADSPWLDVMPGDEGQAELLRALTPIAQPDWQTALIRLDAHTEPAQPAVFAPAAPEAPRPIATAASTPAVLTSTPSFDSPKPFLLHVMNDNAVPLALRIDAAKALLRAAHGGSQSSD